MESTGAWKMRRLKHAPELGSAQLDFWGTVILQFVNSEGLNPGSILQPEESEASISLN